MYKCVLAFAVAMVMCSSARGDLVLSIDDIQVPDTASVVRVAVKVSGPDPINNISLAFGLGDGGADFGGTELAKITGFSLDQTIWDVDAGVGSVSTPALGSASMTPPAPTGATVLNLAGATGTTAAPSSTGVLAYFDLNLAARSDRTSPLVLNPNFASFTSPQGPSQATIRFSAQSGTLRFTAVPEPSSIVLLTLTAGWPLMQYWRGRRSGR